MTLNPRSVFSFLLVSALSLTLYAFGVAGCGDGITRTEIGQITVRVGETGSSEDNIQFRAPQLLHRQTEIVIVKNVGGADLNLSDVRLEETSPYIDFEGQHKPSMPRALRPEESMQVTIEINPLDLDIACPDDPPEDQPNYCGKLIIESDDIDRSYIEVLINVSRSSGKISVVPTDLDFEDRAPGDPETLEFVVTNVGNDALEIQDIQKQLPDDFTIQGRTPPYYISPAGSAVYEVIYDPIEAGQKEGQITVVSSDPTAPNTVILVSAGETLAAEIEVSHTEVSFLNQPEGVPQQITVRNAGGGAALLVYSVRVDPANADYSVAGTFGGETVSLEEQVTIPMAQVLTVDISFHPQDQGTNGTLVIRSNDADETTVTVNLIGSDVVAPLIEVSPFGLTWSLQPGESQSQALTVRNVGDADLEVSGVLIQPLSPTDEFSYSPAPFTPTIPPNGEETLTVTYARNEGDIGDDAANLVISSNAMGMPDVTVTLTTNNPTE